MLAQQQGWEPGKDVHHRGPGRARCPAGRRSPAARSPAFVWGDGGAVTELQGKSKVLLRLDTRHAEVDQPGSTTRPTSAIKG